MSNTIAAEAEIGTESDTSQALVVTSSGETNCSASPQWWCVDLSVRGQVFDTVVGPRATPDGGELLSFPGQAPGLFVRLSWSTISSIGGSPRSAIGRTVLVDATSRSYFVFASAVTVHVVGPRTLQEFAPNRPRPARVGANVSFGQIGATVYPCCGGRGPSHGRFTSRALVPAAGGSVLVVPTGAISLQIEDSAAASPWLWANNNAALGTFGGVPIPAGGFLNYTLVPNATAIIAPPGAVDRNVVLSWGIDV